MRQTVRQTDNVWCKYKLFLSAKNVFFLGGFSLVEAMVVLILISVMLATTVSVITRKDPGSGTHKAVLGCLNNTTGINFDASGNITSLPTSGSCFAAYYGCQINNDGVCPTLFSYADGLGTAAQALSALKILRASCDQGGEKACNYFISRCIANAANCSSPDPNYTLRYYTGMLDSVTNIGKDVIVDKLSDYYIWNVNALTEEIDNNCCNPDFTAACIAKGLTACLPPPEAPTGLTVEALGNNVTLIWTDNSNDEEGFKIFKSTDGGGIYTLATTVAANTTTTTINSLSTGAYYFQVKSYKTGGGNSNPSNSVFVNVGIAPNAPSELVSTVNELDVTLTWTDNSNNETGFKIINASNGQLVYTVGANTTSHTLTGVSIGDNQYKVVAYNDGGNSTDSNTTTATVAAPPPPDPACGAVTIGSLRISLCNNTYNLVANSVNPGASGCWEGLSSACSGTGCSRPVCTHDGAVAACNALNGGIDRGTRNWRLPTNAEIQQWRTNPGAVSAIIAGVKTSLDLCDSSSSQSPYCALYTGCTGSYNSCRPFSMWSAEQTGTNYYYYNLNTGFLYGPYSLYNNAAFTARCVRNL